ncbi:hypothetical protein [Rhodohalobacter sp. 8-1]|uniref:hypothetical protein n=1 Tax=Rhodohalobacter sp. 8-1 TaxID=3131972 RepID=UPI0030EBE37A
MKQSFISLIIAAISVIFLSGYIFFYPWSVSPSSYYYSNVGFGQYADKEFTVTAGSNEAGGGTVSITGQDASMFSCVSGCTYYIEDEEQHSVTIRFTAPSCYDGGLQNYGATVESPENYGVITASVGASVTGSAPKF